MEDTREELGVPKSRFTCSKISPITGLDRPRGLQEVKVPRFRDNGSEWW